MNQALRSFSTKRNFARGAEFLFVFSNLRPFSTRRNFPRGAEFLFVLSNSFPPEKLQDKEKSTSARKIPRSGKRPLAGFYRLVLLYFFTNVARMNEK
jgi:hypothetical protein